jgi:hypothetical protein
LYSQFGSQARLASQIASTFDLVRMLEASSRAQDTERLHRMRRMLELER